MLCYNAKRVVVQGARDRQKFVMYLKILAVDEAQARGRNAVWIVSLKRMFEFVVAEGKGYHKVYSLDAVPVLKYCHQAKYRRASRESWDEMRNILQ